MATLTTQSLHAAAPQVSPSAVFSRVQPPARESMTPQQQEIYDLAVKYLGGPYGPRIALINSPGVAQAWSDLLTSLEATKLDRRLWELTILIVAREWNSQFEWWAHAKPAAERGVPVDVIEAIRLGRRPKFSRPDEAAVYAYFTELYHTRDISDATYERLRGIIGTNGVVEMTVLAGHYNNVAMTLAAHRVPLPPGAKPELATEK